MTRSPLTSAAIALVPLAALAWPLAEVIKPIEISQVSIEEPPVVGTAKRADISLRAAHPYSSVEVTIGDSVCRFAADEDFKEILFTIPESGEVTMSVSATWTQGTPETAILIELEPDHLIRQSFTLWGIETATDKFICQWEVPE
ncbi:MAG: hypothetical protein P8H96_09155 [Akkermansiaceae bacterium]|nr:hypothetical protein [Akkermansiaceae bacterium]